MPFQTTTQKCDQIIKHLRRIETDLVNLASLPAAEEMFPFGVVDWAKEQAQTCHNKRLEVERTKEREK